MSVEIKNVTKNFGAYTALKDVSLTIQPGELIAMIGPSGSGKTTLLRIIAGLESADKGAVSLDGEDTANMTVGERRVGFVFQNYALFRHMTVAENIAFGLTVRPHSSRPAKQEIIAKVHELLSLVKLDGLADRYPNQLSGGQRQRVALARALAIEPRILLLDEPFGALDTKVRKELRRWLRQLHDELHITSILVTHDQEEALEVADRVVIVNNGKIEQVGTPEQVYEQPANAFVYKFLGAVNQFSGRIHQGKLKINLGEIDIAECVETIDTQVISYVRPYNMSIEHKSSGSGCLEARVIFIRVIGPLVHLELKLTDTGDLVEAEMNRERHDSLNLQAGDIVFVRPNDLKIFTADSGGAML